MRALAKDIGRAMEDVIAQLNMQWQIGIRNGDTDIYERQKQTRNMPEVLIITPESLMLLLAQKNYPNFFKSLRIIAVDEWHELFGSKRGVQVELAISRLMNVKKSMVNGQWSIEENIQQTTINNRSSIKNSKNNSSLSTVNYQVSTSIWGISATIGNLEEAKKFCFHPFQPNKKKKQKW